MTDDDPPSLSGPAPSVLMWFKLYCGLLCFTYLGVAALSLVFFAIDPGEADMDPAEAKVLGVLFLVLGIVFSGACLVPLVAQPRPWVWIYDLVIICMGLTSLCCMPMSIPLMIYWMKPDVKAYFGRT